MPINIKIVECLLGFKAEIASGYHKGNCLCHGLTDLPITWSNKDRLADWLIDKGYIIMENRYEVVVSNIGTVYSGKFEHIAIAEFLECQKLSIDGHGRFAGESVTLFINGEPDRISALSGLNQI